MAEPRILTEVRSHRGSKRRTLLLDGEPWLSLSVEILRELELRPGDAVDTDDLMASVETLSGRFARERCLRLLSARERTEVELLRRLRDDGYEDEVARATVSDLMRTGLVDDRRFAESVARSLIDFSRFGRTRAFRELLRRGVSEELAGEILDSYAPTSTESDRALASAQRLAKAGDTVPRLAARLARRGFAASDALAAARQVVPERQESSWCDPF